MKNTFVCISNHRFKSRGWILGFIILFITQFC